MLSMTLSILFFSLLVPVVGQTAIRGSEKEPSAEAEEDKAEIIDHIHGIFRAYMRRDRDAIRRAHTEDWTGFQGPSVGIERGIEAYMKNADNSLANLHATGYELIDTEVQLYGDVAVVYYVARYDFRTPEGLQGSLPLRSVDIYRREPDGSWNQCGSHIGPISRSPGWVATPGGSGVAKAEDIAAVDAPQLSPPERRALLSARETVWRAWFEHDAETLGDRLPEEVIAIDAGVEQWADRRGVFQRAKEFKDSGARLIRLEFPETRIQFYGDAAMLYTRYEFETENRGVRTVQSGRATEFFVRRNGRWLNSGWHLDSVPSS